MNSHLELLYNLCTLASSHTPGKYANLMHAQEMMHTESRREELMSWIIIKLIAVFFTWFIKCEKENWPLQ